MHVVQRARSRSQRLRHNQWSTSTNSTANQSTNSYVFTHRRKRRYSYSNYKLHCTAVHLDTRKRRAFEHQQHSANPYQLPLCDVTRCHTHQRSQPGSQPPSATDKEHRWRCSLLETNESKWFAAAQQRAEFCTTYTMLYSISIFQCAVHCNKCCWRWYRKSWPKRTAL